MAPGMRKERALGPGSFLSYPHLFRRSPLPDISIVFGEKGAFMLKAAGAHYIGSPVGYQDEQGLVRLLKKGMAEIRDYAKRRGVEADFTLTTDDPVVRDAYLNLPAQYGVLLDDGRRVFNEKPHD